MRWRGRRAGRRRGCAAASTKRSHELVVGALQHDDARGGRALLPLVVEGAETTLSSTATSRSASASTMMAFLPPISAMTRFTPLARRVRGRLLDDAQADLPGAGEGDEVDVGVAHQRVADRRRRAGQEVDRARRRARRVQDRDQLGADDRRRPGRLDDDGVAGDERRARHAGEDGQREVPGRDDEPRRRAAGRSSRCSSPGPSPMRRGLGSRRSISRP